MAAEIFTLGERDFRLPGLGAFLQTAADTGDLGAIGWGLFSLAVVIVVLDQLVWRPLLVWSRRFRLEFVEREEDSTSWFYDLWQRSMLVAWIGRRLRWLNDLLGRWLGQHPADDVPTGERRRSLFGWIALAVIIVLTGWGLLNGSRFLFSVSLTQWGEILLGVAATFGRVSVAMCIALLWTVPLGVLIGTRQKIAAVLQPVVQILASIPATALFPVLVLALLEFPGGLNLAAIALMMLGTQWYILFNVIAGVNAIPQDLRFTSDLLQLHGWRRWRTLILPGLFPYLITGLITASGGAWNASIVAEYVVFNQQTYQTIGIGSTIAAATDAGDFAKLFAATLTMIITVVTINRLVWRRLYRLAEDRYRLE
jgi:NitT/TauT family transport system permease protein